jgi:hypothetical protein
MSDRGRSASPKLSRSKRDGSRDSGSSSERSHRSRSKSKERKKKKAAKKKPYKKIDLDPANLSREDLIEKIRKIAKFAIDRGSGNGLVECFERRLLPDDITILLVMFRKFTEIQTVCLKNCLLTDEILESLCKG